MTSRNRSPESRLEESWRANAEAWTKAVREHRIESRRLGTDGALLRTLVSREPGRLLDLGCGEGWLARSLAPHGFEVTGVDGSRELVEAAEGLGGGRFEVLQYDQLVDDPAVVPGPFELIVCNFSLLSEHLNGLLTALAGRLTAEGELIIQTVHPMTATGSDRYENGWREEAFSAFEGEFVASMPWFFRTLGSWIEELLAAGLVLVECREPVHPDTGRPLSLLLIIRTLRDGEVIVVGGDTESHLGEGDA